MGGSFITGDNDLVAVRVTHHNRVTRAGTAIQGVAACRRKFRQHNLNLEPFQLGVHWRLPVQSFTQLPAGPEIDHLPFGDQHGFAGFRISPPPRGFVPDDQTAKLDQFDRFSTNECVFQRRKNSVDDFSRISLGDVQFVGDGQGQFLSGEILLVHCCKS